MAHEFTDAAFDQEVMRFNGVVLVDFWAPWCGPCKMQGPIIDEVVEELKGYDNIKVGKVNIDENQVTAQQFSIMSIPTLIIFKDGQIVEQMIGLQSKEALVNKLKAHAK